MKNRNVSLSDEVFALCPLFPKATGGSFNTVHVMFYDNKLSKFVNADDAHIIYCRTVSDLLTVMPQLVSVYRDEVLCEPDSKLRELEKYVKSQSQCISRRQRGVRPA